MQPLKISMSLRVASLILFSVTRDQHRINETNLICIFSKQTWRQQKIANSLRIRLDNTRL